MGPVGGGAILPGAAQLAAAKEHARAVMERLAALKAQATALKQQRHDGLSLPPSTLPQPSSLPQPSFAPPSLPPFIMASPLASIARVSVQSPAIPSASAPVAVAPIVVASSHALSDYLSLDPGPVFMDSSRTVDGQFMDRVFMDMAPLASTVAPLPPRAPRTPVASPLGALAPALAPATEEK